MEWKPTCGCSLQSRPLTDKAGKMWKRPEGVERSSSRLPPDNDCPADRQQPSRDTHATPSQQTVPGSSPPPRIGTGSHLAVAGPTKLSFGGGESIAMQSTPDGKTFQARTLWPSVPAGATTDDWKNNSRPSGGNPRNEIPPSRLFRMWPTAVSYFDTSNQRTEIRNENGKTSYWHWYSNPAPLSTASKVDKSSVPGNNDETFQLTEMTNTVTEKGKKAAEAGVAEEASREHRPEVNEKKALIDVEARSSADNRSRSTGCWKSSIATALITVIGLLLAMLCLAATVALLTGELTVSKRGEDVLAFDVHLQMVNAVFDDRLAEVNSSIFRWTEEFLCNLLERSMPASYSSCHVMYFRRSSVLARIRLELNTLQFEYEMRRSRVLVSPESAVRHVRRAIYRTTIDVHQSQSISIVVGSVNMVDPTSPRSVEVRLETNLPKLCQGPNCTEEDWSRASSVLQQLICNEMSHSLQDWFDKATRWCSVKINDTFDKDGFRAAATITLMEEKLIDGARLEPGFSRSPILSIGHLIQRSLNETSILSSDRVKKLTISSPDGEIFVLVPFDREPSRPTTAASNQMDDRETSTDATEPNRNKNNEPEVPAAMKMQAGFELNPRMTNRPTVRNPVVRPVQHRLSNSNQLSFWESLISGQHFPSGQSGNSLEEERKAGLIQKEEVKRLSGESFILYPASGIPQSKDINSSDDRHHESSHKFAPRDLLLPRDQLGSRDQLDAQRTEVTREDRPPQNEDGFQGSGETSSSPNGFQFTIVHGNNGMAGSTDDGQTSGNPTASDDVKKYDVVFGEDASEEDPYSNLEETSDYYGERLEDYDEDEYGKGDGDEEMYIA